MVFQSSVESAVNRTRRYFAEIGSDHVFEVAVYRCAVLNCSLKMATASRWLCTTNFAREICLWP